GAVCVVFAVKPRFNIPHDWGKDPGKPSSFLFFRQIVKVTPKAWADAFADKTRTVEDLQRDYIKNAILETYLIAEKVREKLVYLEPGVDLLTWSTRILFGWVILYVLAVLLVPIQEKTA